MNIQQTTPKLNKRIIISLVFIFFTIIITIGAIIYLYTQKSQQSPITPSISPTIIPIPPSSSPSPSPLSSPLSSSSPALSSFNYFLYGPWIKNDSEYIPVKKTATVNNKNVYMIEDDNMTKMVSEDGVSKYYPGNSDSFDPIRWNNYIDTNMNYKLRKCPSICTKGCDNKENCESSRKFKIKNLPSGFCLQHIPNNTNIQTKICENNDTFNFIMTDNNSLKNISSGKCAYLQDLPMFGKTMFMGDECDSDKVKFEITENGFKHITDGCASINTLGFPISYWNNKLIRFHNNTCNSQENNAKFTFERY